ncbi:MAG TPA: transketolase [Betaproteobacteria bacterium]|nr:transketolase [Betaproteobacteria bacterium]
MSKNIKYADAIRALAMDAVQKANSGHPGMPMGMADIATVLWQKHLRHNPANPNWVNRDRFVISNGHGSMLLYSLLHLSGYDLSIEELKNFRQLHSKTPGHPEYGVTPGVETTTGPLGQGVANAVGMAIAEKVLASDFNRPDHEVINHFTYVFLGDGCLMEGVSHEVCSLAGTLGLNKLVLFYDDNGISIDSEKGEMSSWFSDDTPKRFEAYGWNVIRDIDGHDPEQIDTAIIQAKASSNKPTIICCKTIIGKGSPKKQNTGSSHGAPLGEDEVIATREALGWPHAPFEIPDEVYSVWNAQAKGQALENEWAERQNSYQNKYPGLNKELNRRLSGKLPSDWTEKLDSEIQIWDAKSEKLATRKASQNALEFMGPNLPELIGGSADLAASNLTMWSGSNPIGAARTGNYLFYGVREFGMAAIMNGLALHGGFIPYGATFLVFSDYCRNALRVAALMNLRSIFVFTHDSIGLGEDGPTHQPVEHAASLRLIPNLDVWRPCDAVETMVAWGAMINRVDGPSCLLATRQGVPHQEKTSGQIKDISKGAYVLSDADDPQAIIVATGSEVSLAIDAQRVLEAEGVLTRVVSMPSTDVFDRQDSDYREAVLPNGLPKVAVEAGVTDFWRKYVGIEGAVVGVDTFGESAPAAALYEHFGVTVQAVVNAVRAIKN